MLTVATVRATTHAHVLVGRHVGRWQGWGPGVPASALLRCAILVLAAAQAALAIPPLHDSRTAEGAVCVVESGWIGLEFWLTGCLGGAKQSMLISRSGNG
jgi:hypothetical protein